MKKQKKKKKMKKSTYYICSVLAGIIGYKLLELQPFLYITAIGTWRSMQFLRLFFIVTMVAGTWLSRNYERNLTSICLNTVLAVAVYPSMVTMYYFRGIIKYVVIGGGLWWLLANGLARLYAENCRNKAKRKLLIRLERREICKVGLALMLTLVMLYGSNLLEEEEVVIETAKEFVTETENEENLLETEIETLARLHSWPTLEDEEKMEILELAVKIGCQELGMHDSLPELKVSYMENSLLGYYTDDEDAIYLNLQQFRDGDAYNNLETLFHELRHRYQHYQVAMVEAMREDETLSQYSALAIFEETGIYETELNNYVSGTSDYLTYYTQAVEEDARTYGLETSRRFYYLVREYIESREP